jgi:hypothetical protein
MTDKVSYMHYVVSNMIVHLFCCCSKVKVGITYDVVKTCLAESDSENRRFILHLLSPPMHTFMNMHV